MKRVEQVELTTLCLVENGDYYLLQDRVKNDWKGYTFPGGHMEPGESIVDGVNREMKEETGLLIKRPKLCGIKQFPIENGRYLVFLFRTNEFEGELVSSEEGQMHWVHKKNLDKVHLVEDFHELLMVMLDDSYNEFQYVIEDDDWKVVIK